MRSTADADDAGLRLLATGCRREPPQRIVCTASPTLVARVVILGEYGARSAHEYVLCVAVGSDVALAQPRAPQLSKAYCTVVPG